MTSSDSDTEMYSLLHREHVSRSRTRAVSNRSISRISDNTVDCEVQHANNEYSSADGLVSCCHTPGTLQRKPEEKQIGVTSLVLLIFFTVSGGLLGSEELISSHGPFLGLLTCVLFPWIYSLPVALMAAELSAAFPEDGGYTIWVSQAFGPFWAFQEGYWSWVGGVLDNAMYPVIVADVLFAQLQTYDVDFEGFQFSLFPKGIARAILAVIIALVMSLPNFFGVKLVGRALLFLSFFVMVPFVVFIVVGIPTTDPAEWFVMNSTAIDSSDSTKVAEGSRLMHLLNVAFWSFSGWDSASTFAGEVEDPGSSYPKALVGSVALVTISYLVPLLVAVGNESYLAANGLGNSNWEDGSFVLIGGALGGKALQMAFLFSSVASSTAMYVTEMCVDSFLLLGMAEHGLAPSMFAQRSNSCGAKGNPTNALLASLFIITIASAVLRFDELLWVNNCLAGLSIALEIFAAIHIKFSAPLLKKPFSLNLSPVAFTIMLLPAIAVLFLVVVSSFVGKSTVLILSGAIILLGIGAFFVQQSTMKVPAKRDQKLR